MFEEIRSALATTLQQFGDVLFTNLPRFLGAVLLFAAGFVVARITRGLIRRLFVRAAKLPAWGRIDPRRLARSSDLVANSISWIIFCVTIAAVAEALGLRLLSLLGRGFVEHVPRITGTILILLAGYILGRLLRDLIASLTATTGAVRSELLGNAALYTVFVITVLIAADQTGVNVGFLANLIIVVLGALLFGGALAFALGANLQVSNILAAYSIQKIYRVGQRIRVETYVGRILSISATGVTLETPEGSVYIPARKFSQCESVLLPEE
ncbi:MAG: mechanosensitive ion channel [bacterium]|nr:mechanosensitive ion channel [bacterium]